MNFVLNARREKKGVKGYNYIGLFLSLIVGVFLLKFERILCGGRIYDWCMSDVESCKWKGLNSSMYIGKWW